MGGFETKSFRILDIKAKGEGRFHAVANAYGIKDSCNEIVEAGFFKRSLDQQGPSRVHLWQHSWFDPIGRGDHYETDNLEVDGRLNLGVQRGREAYELMKEGDIDHMSIGYDVYKDLVDETGVRHLIEGRLYESSPVTFAANELAIIDAVKAYGYGRGELALIIGQLKAIADPVSEIVTRHQAGRLTIEDREVAARASSILQDLIARQKEEAGPGDHPAPSGGSGDPQPAEQLSDPDVRSLMEAARSIRELVKLEG